MTLSSRIRIAVLAATAAAAVVIGPAWIGYESARGEAPYVLHVDDTSPVPVLLAQADTGSAAPAAAEAPAAVPAADPAPAAEAPAAGSATDVPPIGDPLAELAALKAKYDALKAAKDSGSRDLLWFAYAALAAAAIRIFLAGLTAWRGDKPKGWAKWAALGAAVPLYLLTYYAAGAGLWAAIVMAGAGPGAIVANELIKHFGKGASK